jgi:LmbE family N-acetylglucosaminyl deacetylase
MGGIEGLKSGAESVKHRVEEGIQSVEHKAEDVGYGIKARIHDLGEGIKEKVHWGTKEVPAERVLRDYYADKPSHLHEEKSWWTPLWDMARAVLILIPATMAMALTGFGTWEVYAKTHQYRTIQPPSLHAAYPPVVTGKAEKVTTEPSGRRVDRAARCAFILAHGDDETMFFAPTITDIKKMGHEVYLQVMTAGSLKADPRSSTRKMELLKAAHILGISHENVEVVEDVKLQERGHWLDHMDVVKAHVNNFVQRNAITHIYTYDRLGVTHNANHAAVSQGVREYLKDHPEIRGFELQTVWKLRQWAGLCDLFWSLCETMKSRRNLYPQDHIYLHMNALPLELYYAMDKSHWANSFVFIRLFRVLLNRYAFINSYKQTIGLK